MKPKGQVIITGVSSGIGHAIATKALAEGYYVQGISRNEPLDLRGKGRWSFFSADLTRPEAIDTIPFMTGDAGGPTILINNAGVLGPVCKSEEATWKNINKTMNLNIVAPMRLSARFLAEVKGDKQIYFTGSGAAEHVIEGWSAYCTSKAGIHMYANVLQQEYPEVRIHAFKPGKVDTPMQEEIRRSREENFPLVEAFRKEHEEGKLVKPDVVAQKVLKLIGEPADVPVVVSLSEIEL